MEITSDDLIKILLAVAAGGLIGIEREFRDKAAGFRTLIFICVGACLFTIFSARLAVDSDPNRIAANIVTGIGFLGAGVILRDGGRVIGLTTASTIWVTAAFGMGFGGGYFALTGAVVVLMLIVLWFFPRIEHRIDNFREERNYEVVLPVDADKLTAMESVFQEAGLHVRGHRQLKTGDCLTISWQASGSPRSHDEFIHRLIADPDVKEFRY